MGAKLQSFWQNGKITVIWLFVTAVYLGIKIAHIEADQFTNVFVGVSGVFVADLGIRQTTKKSEQSARVERKADHAVAVAEHASDAATGGLPVLIEDNKGNLRPQEPPRIARPEQDRRTQAIHDEEDRRTSAIHDEEDERRRITDKGDDHNA